MLLYRALALAAATVALPLAAVTVRDIDGHEYPFPEEPESKATVVYFVTHDCPISNKYAPEIRRICEEYATRGARCVLAYIDPTISIADIREHQRAYGITAPTVHDKSHAMANLAGASITPEAAVFDDTGHLVYRGRIDNFYAALGTPRRKATEHDLRNALDEVLSGRAVSQSRTQAVGCFIPSLDLAKTEEFQ